MAGKKKRKQKPAFAMGLCQVCDTTAGTVAAAAKYRCPACRVPYCSLACFKRHKAADPSVDGTPLACVPVPPDAAPSAPADAPRARKRARTRRQAAGGDEEAFLLSADQPKRLGSDVDVRNMTKSAQLQKVIRNIVGAKHPARALAQRMEHDPGFAKFADCLLVALGKAQVHETGAILVNLDDGDEGEDR